MRLHENVKHMSTYIVFPCNCLEGNRIDILVEDKRSRDCKGKERIALSSQVERQNFECVSAITREW